MEGTATPDVDKRPCHSALSVPGWGLETRPAGDSPSGFLDLVVLLHHLEWGGEVELAESIKAL